VLEGQPEARDAYTFTVTVEDGDRSHTVVVADSAVPDSLRPLSGAPRRAIKWSS
jgi:hypothetical protein